jgi:hypothetical protein
MFSPPSPWGVAGACAGRPDATWRHSQLSQKPAGLGHWQVPPRAPAGKDPPYWAPWPVCAGGLRAGKAAPARAGGDPGFGKEAQDLRAGHAAHAPSDLSFLDRSANFF